MWDVTGYLTEESFLAGLTYKGSLSLLLTDKGSLLTLVPFYTSLLPTISLLQDISFYGSIPWGSLLRYGRKLGGKSVVQREEMDNWTLWGY